VRGARALDESTLLRAADALRARGVARDGPGPDAGVALVPETRVELARRHALMERADAPEQRGLVDVKVNILQAPGRRAPPGPPGGAPKPRAVVNFGHIGRLGDDKRGRTATR
jgi:hypothetical protein